MYTFLHVAHICSVKEILIWLFLNKAHYSDVYQCISFIMAIWVSFQVEGTKLERFLPKN